MSRKIDARELLAALGGLLVLISLFLDWYERGQGAGASTVTGWRVFETLDLVLAGLAILVIATGARTLGTVASLGPRALLPIGAVLTLIVVVQLVSPPPAAWDAGLEAGAWLALGGSLLVLAGGLLAAASIDITVNVGARDTRRRVPAVDRRPNAGGGSTSAPAEAARRSLLDDEPAAPARAGAHGDEDDDATQPFKPVDDGT